MPAGSGAHPGLGYDCDLRNTESDNARRGADVSFRNKDGEEEDGCVVFKACCPETTGTTPSLPGEKRGGRIGFSDVEMLLYLSQRMSFGSAQGRLGALHGHVSSLNRSPLPHFPVSAEPPVSPAPARVVGEAASAETHSAPVLRPATTRVLRSTHVLVFASPSLHARPLCGHHLLPHRSLQTHTPRKHRQHLAWPAGCRETPAQRALCLGDRLLVGIETNTVFR